MISKILPQSAPSFTHYSSHITQFRINGHTDSYMLHLFRRCRKNPLVVNCQSITSAEIYRLDALVVPAIFPDLEVPSVPEMPHVDSDEQDAAVKSVCHFPQAFPACLFFY
jgi:hypothetical protein